MAEIALAESITELAQFFVGARTAKETLNRVTVLTVEALPPADLASITMLVDQRPHSVVFTDEVACTIDEVQYDTKGGPCLEALEQRRPSIIESTREIASWPDVRQAAADRGISSMLSLPLVAGNDIVGSLNLYAKEERAFGPHELANAELFAAQAAIVVANSEAYWDARNLSAGLAEAMRNRAVIEQAKGILMASEGVDEDHAFEMLTRASQRENRKLRDIAHRMVDDAVARGGLRRDEHPQNQPS